MDALTILWIILTGAIPGFLATWLGIGGCFLRIPMMMGLLGLSIKSAYAVNMMVIGLTTIPGVVMHYRMRHVYTKGFIVAAIGAAAGVVLGTQLAMMVPSATLKSIFGIACVGVGIYMLYVALKTRDKISPRVTVDQVKSLQHGVKLGGLMFVAGVATGLCGFGGGIYYMPVLTALGYPMHIAIGTSSMQMIPVSLIGATNLTVHGYQSWLFMGTIGAVTLLFSWIGARTTAAMKAWLLRAIFGVLIAIVGILVAVGLI
ncbi:MAG: sulfite exporter TauE/SafE family protein [Dehalococcoidales bacterium]|nr:sulfite exporter TauE/SafE family protein [Dehalococcoidales bacterium]